MDATKITRPQESKSLLPNGTKPKKQLIIILVVSIPRAPRDKLQRITKHQQNTEIFILEDK